VAREKANGVAEFREGNVLELSQIEETFSAIVDDHCFHCIVGKDRAVFLAGTYSRLVEGGTLIVRTQCGDPPTIESPEFMKMWDPVMRCQVYNGIAGRYFGLAEDILAEVVSAGFKIRQVEVHKEPEGWDMIEIQAIKF
jgi:hypothetical protein